MAGPFKVYKGGRSDLGQATTPTSVVPPVVVSQDIIDALTYRGYRIQSGGPKDPIPPVPHAVHVPGIHEPPAHLPPLHTPEVHVPHEPVHEPVHELPPLHVPEGHVPYEPVSPYAKYLRFLPYLLVLIPESWVMDLGEVL